tara:strand:- start:979 stop:1185 length:207 start_codon:yes stop_codon:yes gene_type:complete
VEVYGWQQYVFDDFVIGVSTAAASAATSNPFERCIFFVVSAQLHFAAALLLYSLAEQRTLPLRQMVRY